MVKSNVGVGAGGGGGGEGFALGPVTNEFADVAARNTYATANAAWLALYNGDRSLWIRVGGAAGDIQRRNAAGTGWENVTAVVSGPKGAKGDAGAGTDQTARDAAAAAQTDIDDHEENHPTGGGGGNGGGGGGEAVAVTKKTVVQVKTGTPCEMDPFAPDSEETQAHGLGAEPDTVLVYAECLTVQESYAVGDRINVQDPWGFTVMWDDTNVVIRTVDTLSRRPPLVSASDNDQVALTAANWKVVAVPILYEDVDVVTGVTGGGGGGGEGSGLSEVSILAPDSDPDKDDWEAHAAQWNGREMIPVVREFHTGHGAIVRFATINTAVANRGEEIINTGTYAEMQSSVLYHHTTAWSWVAAQDVVIGDLSTLSFGGTPSYYRCIRAHTTGVGVDAGPNVAGQTGWEVYTPIEMPEKDNWLGIYRQSEDVPAAELIANNWFTEVYNGHMGLLRYSAVISGWITYRLPGIGTVHVEHYTSNAQAAAAVRELDVDAPDMFLVSGHIKIVSFYSEPADDEETFRALPIERHDPVIEMWGRAQNARLEEPTAAATSSVRFSHASRLFLRWKATPSDLFFGAENDLIDVLTQAEINALSGVDNVISSTTDGVYFKLRSGLWSFGGYGNIRVVPASVPVIRFIKVNPTGGADDILLGASTSADRQATPDDLIGEPDLFYGLLLEIPLIRVQPDDVLYAVYVGQSLATTTDARHFLQATYHGLG